MYWVTSRAANIAKKNYLLNSIFKSRSTVIFPWSKWQVAFQNPAKFNVCKNQHWNEFNRNSHKSWQTTTSAINHANNSYIGTYNCSFITLSYWREERKNLPRDCNILLIKYSFHSPPQIHRKMAPQNSTLIHGNAVTTPTASAEEELSSYSPILPTARASRRRRASPDSGADASLPPPPPPPNFTKSIASFGRYSFRPEAQTSFSQRNSGTRSEGIEKGAVKRDSVCNKSEPSLRNVYF